MSKVSATLPPCATATPSTLVSAFNDAPPAASFTSIPSTMPRASKDDTTTTLEPAVTDPLKSTAALRRTSTGSLKIVTGLVTLSWMLLDSDDGTELLTTTSYFPASVCATEGRSIVFNATLNCAPSTVLVAAPERRTSPSLTLVTTKPPPSGSAALVTSIPLLTFLHSATPRTTTSPAVKFPVNTGDTPPLIGSPSRVHW